MNEYWNNLRPLEKRLVVAVGSVLFIVLNFWFVIPRFSDLSKADMRIGKAKKTLNDFLKEINRKPFYQSNINFMQGEGLSVPQEDQAFSFVSAINNQAMQSGVDLSGTGKIRSDTNQFFLELSQTINVVSTATNLVDFLYNLGAGNSLIRVRDLSLRPDPPRQRLLGSIKLVANYQRKVPIKTSTPATGGKSAAPAPKTATTPEKSSTTAPHPADAKKAPNKGPEVNKSAPTNAPPFKRTLPTPIKK
jgi:Tfp pilus assembly protein PilO